jgi:hypothetical protein
LTTSLTCPLARASALHQEQQIVRIAARAKTSALQLLVQLIQQDVGEQRRQVAALWRTDRRRFDALANQDTLLQVLGNQDQQPFGGAPSGALRLSEHRTGHCQKRFAMSKSKVVSLARACSH